MPYLLWPVLASTAAVLMETYARATHVYTWWFIPGALIVNYGVFRTVIGAPSFLTAFAVFGAVNTVSRIILSRVVLHEPTTSGNVAVAILLLAATIAGFVWA